MDYSDFFKGRSGFWIQDIKMWQQALVFIMLRFRDSGEHYPRQIYYMPVSRKSRTKREKTKWWGLSKITGLLFHVPINSEIILSYHTGMQSMYLTGTRMIKHMLTFFAKDILAVFGVYKECLFYTPGETYFHGVIW